VLQVVPSSKDREPIQSAESRLIENIQVRLRRASFRKFESRRIKRIKKKKKQTGERERKREKERERVTERKRERATERKR